MEIKFETMIGAGESPLDLIIFFRQHLPEYEEAEWDGAMPRLFKRGVLWLWEEIVADGVRDVPEEEAECLGLTKVIGDLVWRTATSGYLYSLCVDRSDEFETYWRRWEYYGPRRGFGRQKFLPPECVRDPKAAGRLRVQSAEGTYGRFERHGEWDDPLTEYARIADAWAAPFTALTGKDSKAAADAWKALQSLPKKGRETLLTLFDGLDESERDRRRAERLRRKAVQAA